MSKHSIFYIGEWKIESDLNMISKGQEEWIWTPRIMDFFVFFLNRPNEVLTNEVLMTEVWTDRITTKESLLKVASELRKLLKSDFQGQLVLETHRSIGYRLNCPFLLQSDEFKTGETSLGRKKWNRKSINWIVGMLLASLLLLFILSDVTNKQTQLSLPLDHQPITSLKGLENFPSLSPNNKQLVYAWQEESGERFHIYLRALEDSNARRLSDYSGSETFPTWSADGQKLYFIRWINGQKYLIASSVIGEDEKEITALNLHKIHGALSVSADGKWLAFSAKVKENTPFTVYLVNLKDGRFFQHSKPPITSYGDLYPVFSKENLASISFVRVEEGEKELRNNAPVKSTIISTEISRGKEEIIFTIDQSIGSFTQNGAYFFTLHDNDLYTLPPKGAAQFIQQLPSGLIKNMSSTYQPRGLIYEVWNADLLIKKFDILPNNSVSTEGQELINSNHWEWGLNFDRTGKKAAFISDRSGFHEVCLMDSTKNGQIVQLSNIRSEVIKWCSISPDGEKVIFTHMEKGKDVLFMMNTNGQNLQRLDIDEQNIAAPEWSIDGKSLFFSTNKTGNWEIWLYSIEGANSQQITQNGGYKIIPTETGIFYSKFEQSGIWYLPNESDNSTTIIPASFMDDYVNWVVSTDGIYFLTWSFGASTLYFYDFQTSEVSDIGLVQGFIENYPSLTISPNNKQLFITEGMQIEADIQMTFLE